MSKRIKYTCRNLAAGKNWHLSKTHNAAAHFWNPRALTPDSVSHRQIAEGPPKEKKLILAGIYNPKTVQMDCSLSVKYTGRNLAAGEMPSFKNPERILLESESGNVSVSHR